MIEFVISKNTAERKFGCSDVSYFVQAICYDKEHMFDKHLIDIRQCLNIDRNSFNETLKLYNGIIEHFDYIFIPDPLVFKTEEEADKFIKEYLEPQLIAAKLL